MAYQSLQMQGYRAAKLFSTKQAGSVGTVVSVFFHVLSLIDEAMRRSANGPVDSITTILDEMGAHAIDVRPSIRRAFTWAYLNTRDRDPYFPKQDNYLRALTAARIVHRALAMPPSATGFLEVQSENGRAVAFYVPCIFPEERSKDGVMGYEEAHYTVSSAQIVGKHFEAAMTMAEVLKNE